MGRKPARKQLSFEIPEDLHTDLRITAFKEQVSLTAACVEAVQTWIASRNNPGASPDPSRIEPRREDKSARALREILERGDKLLQTSIKTTLAIFHEHVRLPGEPALVLNEDDATDEAAS